MDIKDVVKARVKARRQALELTQDALAHRTDLSARFISSVETTSQNLTLDTITDLARGLQCTVYDLLAPPSKKNGDEIEISMPSDIGQEIRDLQVLKTRLDDTIKSLEVKVKSS